MQKQKPITESSQVLLQTNKLIEHTIKFKTTSTFCNNNYVHNFPEFLKSKNRERARIAWRRFSTE